MISYCWTFGQLIYLLLHFAITNNASTNNLAYTSIHIFFSDVSLDGLWCHLDHNQIFLSCIINHFLSYIISFRNKKNVHEKLHFIFSEFILFIYSLIPFNLKIANVCSLTFRQYFSSYDCINTQKWQKASFQKPYIIDWKGRHK